MTRGEFVRRYLWPSWEQRKRLLWREAWVVVVAAYPLLAFAYLLPQNWRNESPAYGLAWLIAFAVRVLQFHLGLLLLIVVVAAVWRKRRRLLLVALPPGLCTLAPAMIQFIPQGQEPGAQPALRVMSVNLLMVNSDKEGIISEIRAANPDVLMLQEYTAAWDEAIRRSLGAHYPYASTVMRDDSFGIALFSRTPFAAAVDQRFPLGRAGVNQMRAEIDVQGKRFALYNVHLLPPRTLIYAGEHRLQFADLLDTLSSEKLPYVVCGDFNFPETSPQHRDLRRAGVREAHKLAGVGRGATWPVNSVFRYVMPGVRIDHVYLSGDLTATRCETGTGRGSDHRPVIADVAVRARAAP